MKTQLTHDEVMAKKDFRLLIYCSIQSLFSIIYDLIRNQLIFEGSPCFSKIIVANLLSGVKIRPISLNWGLF